MTFCRLGGLSTVKHKIKKETFHTPPTKKGIYAFMWPYIEMFLVMWSERNIQELKIKGFRKFKYDGPIWCHFDDARSIIDVGAWCLTHTDYLNDIFQTSIQKSRDYLMSKDRTFVRDPYKRGSCETITFSRDHLEVYIDGKYSGRIR